MAYFLHDKRPFESNLGNYIEFIVDGDWLIRLAHLRDLVLGQGWVRAGELLGYAGHSGASAAHLHLELFVRSGKKWVRPDIARIEHVFGLALADFVEGADIANDGCPAQLVLASAVQSSTEPIGLGEAAELNLALRNDGLDSVTLDNIQVSLYDPAGNALVAEAQGTWTVEGKAVCPVAVRVQPNMPGTWRIGRVTCQAGETSYALAAEGALTVSPSALRLVGISSQPSFAVGDRLTFEAWIENTGESDLVIDDLHFQGVRPDGVPWGASTGRAGVVPGRGVTRFLLHSSTVPMNVGFWKITRVGYEREKRLLFFGQADESFTVLGPELRIDRVAAYAGRGKLNVFLTITNVGTRVAAPDAIEVWGWKPDGEHPFSMRNDKAPVLAPGKSALVRLGAPLAPDEGLWRLVEAGYWTHGDFYPMELPEQPAVAVDQPTQGEMRQPR
jgi:hypothetical protein